MGKRGTCPPPSGNVVMCFYALVVTAKRSADELFMYYFHKLSSASGPHRGSIPGTRWGTFVPRLLIYPPLEKILQVPLVHSTSFVKSYEDLINSFYMKLLQETEPTDKQTDRQTPGIITSLAQVTVCANTNGDSLEIGKWQTSTHRRTKTPKPIANKIVMGDQVVEKNRCTKFGADPSMEVFRGDRFRRPSSRPGSRRLLSAVGRQAIGPPTAAACSGMASKQLSRDCGWLVLLLCQRS